MGKITFHHESSLPKDVLIPDAHRPSAEVGKEIAENHRLNATDNHYFAIHNNKVIGHVGIKTEPDDHHSPVINASYIDPKHRGKGIGMALYSHVLAHEPRISSDNAREPGASAIWSKLHAKHPKNVSFDKKVDRFTWNNPAKMGKSESEMNSIQGSDTSRNQMIYIAVDGDDAGRMVGRAALNNDEQSLHEISARIDNGQNVIRSWAESVGGTVVSAGGDEANVKVPADAAQFIEQLRSDYQFATQLTMTAGIGTTLSEAGKALMAGKFRGKDQAVQYEPGVEQEIQAAMSRFEDGTGTEEENKISQSYLAKEDQPGISHADDCQYCQEQPEHDHTDDCQYCQESEPDHDHTDDCQYCAESETAADHDHTDDCQYCAAADEANSHDHSDEDCQYCSESEARMNHDHSDTDCQYCADAMSRQSPEGQQSASALADATITDDPNSQTERNDINAIDEANMPLGNEMEENVSRPEDYNQEMAPADMGLAEEAPQASPDLNEVLKDGLDSHADNIQREKVIDMVSQALDGFKANKQILEKAKEQAPALYSSTIMMLKAMIEMGKMLGLAPSEEQPQDPAQNQTEQTAPQEGAAQSPQQ